MMEIVNKKETCVFAIRRSGQHAIMQWMINNSRGRVVALNSVKYLGKNIFTAQRYTRKSFHNPYWLELDMQKEREGHFSIKDHLIYNSENFDPSAFKKEHSFEKQKEYIGLSNETQYVIVIRDPYNLLASYLNWAHIRHWFGMSLLEGKNILLDIIHLWKKYAKECLEITNDIPHNKKTINFNEWTRSDNYRKELLKELGFDNIDNSTRFVSAAGGGSSFDGTAFDTRGDQMNVLSRWKKYRYNEHFKELFDDEIAEYSRKIFGNIPETDALHKKSNNYWVNYFQAPSKKTFEKTFYIGTGLWCKWYAVLCYQFRSFQPRLYANLKTIKTAFRRLIKA